ncbi:MAG: CvpA family protein [Parvularculales bacterium]
MPEILPDIALTSFIILSAFVGFLRGVLKEILSIASWVLAIVAAVFGTAPLGELFLPVISSPWVAQSLAGALIFVVIFLLLRSLTGRWSVALKNTTANGADRLLGLLFGVARGVFVLAAAWMLFIFLTTPTPPPAWMQSLRLLPTIEAVANILHPLLPNTLSGETSSEEFPQEELPPQI